MPLKCRRAIADDPRNPGNAGYSPCTPAIWPLAEHLTDDLGGTPRTAAAWAAWPLRDRAYLPLRWLDLDDTSMTTLAHHDLSGVSSEFAARLSAEDLNDIAAGDIPLGDCPGMR
jgi:hypothetical protein